MLKRLLPAALIGYVFLIIVNWGCTKLDTTNLGSDLIPAIDNVHTFADTFDIISTQGIFNDTFRVGKNVNNTLGVINGDGLIGSTSSHIFLQVKPPFYPFYWGVAKDTIFDPVDSMVLCLNYAGFWGDSLTPQHLEVYPITDREFSDSSWEIHPINYQPQTLAPSIGSANIDITRLNDTIRTRYDSTITNQIRIKLDQTFAQEFFDYDTTANQPNNFFRSDSLYRSKFHGFAVKATSGNALMYINLTDARTRLEVYYRRKKFNATVIDSTYSYLYVTNTNGTITQSSTSNYIERNWSSNVTSPLAQYLYLVTGPGTYANLKVPSLDTFKTTNRIIHRAEIYFEQEPDLTDGGIDDSLFSPPPYMYLDLADTGSVKWKPLYFDLNPSAQYDPDNKSGLPFYPGYAEYSYFGGVPRIKHNELGQKVNYYKLNVSRYLQHLITQEKPNYTFRLFPAYSFMYPQYSATSRFSYDNPLAFGRIRVKSGAYPDPGKRMKMHMVVIWSKI